MKNNPGWEYCECGCHGCMLIAGDQTFWFDSYTYPNGKTTFQLMLGHGKRGLYIGHFDTRAELDREVVKRLTEALREIQETIQALEPDVGEGI